MGSEDWVLKPTKLITNTKKHTLKVYSKGQSLPNTLLKEQNKVTKNDKIYIYMKFALKIGSFFLKGNSRL